MYNQSYEDYMRSVLGYPMNDETYYEEHRMSTYENDEEIEKMYPEIYKIIHPMVRKVCSENSDKKITKELVEEMTNRVYSNVEVDVNMDSRMNMQVRNPDLKQLDSRRRNFMLKDLINIIILKELLERKHKLGRPPFPGIRPPIRPPFHGVRPPIRPRDLEWY